MDIKLRRLGRQAYQSCWQAMQDFTLSRDHSTADEIWIVEHDPVFTQGLNGKPEHLLRASDIPLVNTDRGGQVTYHAPGQLVVYTLIDIQRRQLGVRQLVSVLEQAMVDALAQYGLQSEAKRNAPGVYIAGEKIGSVGLRIKKGSSYHGLSLNNCMDLSPFSYINPCGYQGLKVTQLVDQGVRINTFELALPVVHSIIQALDSSAC
ncbi:lipoyl(octanoyl) transferase LipB [methanotrophic endosymbiont of Bathymodiolus puteoserpentis (Logatchev)]|jgi:lipoyl(octanoyl) transferase|uniref:lipoyl(octanoyl) transferase LipB n=1 Tax=methanotrophic endosymbiont of Bathymodiolus puteoserpentis (Logatchev) TaxID=343235 RepID=UPI0013C7F271|nr:lipoyl(octanoyl) transferase LipB [methanotrophic endosymbiont of Bathymodiolus puteoserpentis (Logatchev)]SHE22672.1 Octanoate-[acyl-carrier-protein]-protein-N-octan oyltransferase [methanotrophic endosymbiont of Bathymodiolus puteoserpentis (Logatchev)]